MAEKLTYLFFVVETLRIASLLQSICVTLHALFQSMFRPLRDALILLVFWICCFDFHRILFYIYHTNKLTGTSWGEWLLTFVYSIRVDLATAAVFSALPFLIKIILFYYPKKAIRYTFNGISLFLLLILCLIQAGETVAYAEWNHKLTSRVFMHLSHPDEVVRTANVSMTIWFIVIASIQFSFGAFLFKRFFQTSPISKESIIQKISFGLLQFAIVFSGFFLFLRGGLQQIPLNINSATFSNKPIVNDLSINSSYYFGKSYLLYKRSSIDQFLPKFPIKEANEIVAQLYNYPKKHNELFLTKKQPNVVFVVLEGWSAGAIGSLSEVKGATPNFDRLTKEGILFDNIYAASTTSEIGNSTIFSGNPAVPEVSITMQPEKHRKLHALNEDFEAKGYHSSYVFSGDLKYGNIGGYFLDHGFDVVKDENDFPKNLKRGKLNYYDKDLYSYLIKEINANKEPFFQCTFTGSTHAPYDQPKGKGKVFKGQEADYMNSLVYSDEALGEFVQKCKKQPWFKNTVFVFVADHGHANPTNNDPGIAEFYRIPFLIYGPTIAQKYRGKRISKVGSQADVAATLLYQIGGDISRYPWSKDLMNPKAPQFAFHSIINGYGWIRPEGNLTYYMEVKLNHEQTFPKEKQAKAWRECHAFLTAIYANYKEL